MIIMVVLTVTSFSFVSLYFTFIGKKEMFYLTTCSTYFNYGYMASAIMVKGHSDSE